MPTRVSLLSPGSCQGFATSKAPSALPKGIVAGLYDVRLGNGLVRLRWGSLLINGSVASGYLYRGSYECLQNGVRCVFAAYWDGSATRVYRSTNAGVSFSEVTGPSTRLGADAPAFFCLVTVGGVDTLVIQNGTSAPLLYDGTTAKFVPALASDPFRLRLDVDLGGGTAFAGNPATAGNSGEWDAPTGVRPLGDGGYYLYLQADGHIESQDYFRVGPLNDPITVPPEGRQIVFLIDPGAMPSKSSPSGASTLTTASARRDERWRQMVIEGSTNGTAWFSVYDPAATSLIAIEATGTAYLAAVPVSAANAGKVVNYLRFSFKPEIGQSDDPDIVMKLYAVQASGTRPGGTAYGVAYGQPGVTVGQDGPTRSGGSVVVASSPRSYAGIDLPVSGLVGYSHTVRAISGSVVQTPTYVYRRDVGGDGYYYLDAFLGPGSYADAGAASVDLTKALPRADALGVPKGTGMAAINDRLFVCAADRLYYSEAGNPFAFAQLVQFQDGSQMPTSAGSFSKPGERFQAVIGVGQVLTGAETYGTPQSGAVSVYAITDRVTYVLSGFDALSLNKTTPVCVGTRSPYSVARGTSGGFAMLDSDGQIRKVVGTQSTALSKDLVDQQTVGIPTSRLPWVDGSYVGDRYYLAYTPYNYPTPLTTNSRVLVFNEGQGWESIDRLPVPAQGLLPYFDPNTFRTRLLTFSDTTLFEHDAPMSDLETTGSRVAATIEFPEAQTGFTSVEIKGLFLISDVDAGGSAAFVLAPSTRTGGNDVNYPAFSLAANSAGETRAVKRSESGVGVNTLSSRVVLNVSAKGGTQVYNVEGEIKPDSRDEATR